MADNAEIYARFRDHEVRQLLQRAANGAHVYDDQIDDLELPDRLRKALVEAIDRIGKKEKLPGGASTSDQFALAIVEQLDPHHETRAEREARRAGEGDAEARANRQAAVDETQDLADRIIAKRGV